MMTLAMSFLMDAQNAQTVPLNNGWEFSQSGKSDWQSATVPGSVQQDLIRLGKLPDPFYGTNEKLVQWVENEDWEYRKIVEINKNQQSFDDALLSFEGLDTYADVYLNDNLILSAENMFVGYKLSVKNYLRLGKNHLFIRFYSPIKKTMPLRDASGFDYPADNDHREEKLSVYTRKAPYHYGWDWGIRLVQVGIWRNVSLTFYNKARIEDYFVEQKSVSVAQASINNHIEIYSTEKTPLKATVLVQYKPLISNKKSFEIRKEVVLLEGKNSFSLPLTIKNPLLWMPAGWGKQHRYEFTVQVLADKKVIAEKSHKVGLRKVELVREMDKDSTGRSFYFKVNDIPLFAKGANYIPGEIINTLQDKTYYQQLFENVTAANMNMLRVWGGGLYEDDYFYQLADEKGILIWQDFMFACTTYPHDEAFLQNVSREVEYNVKRLRNYACVALWCGNNEIAEAMKHWGWHRKYSKEIFAGFQTGYDKLFKQLIPNKLNELDPAKPYIHTSPDGTNWGNPTTMKLGDAHYWGVWHGREPFDMLNERIPRFMSEFGFQAFPEMKTIRAFASENERNINSDVMKAHQKSGIGNEAIKQYMDKYYHTPQTFKDFVYVGQVMQAEGIREGLEAHRRNQPFCMGTLYWQLNDDWPVVSWSSIDYYGNWKALHYKARDVFAPLALGAALKDNKLTFYTLSEKLKDTENLQLHVQVIDFSGKKLKDFTKSVTAKANSSNAIKTFNSNDLLTEEQKQHCVIHAWLSDKKDEKVIAARNFYFYWSNKLNLPETTIDTKITYADGKYTVTLTSKKLAKNVFIELPVQGAKFSDNFFDLLPNEKRTVVITSPQLSKNQRTEVKIRHLKMTYK